MIEKINKWLPILTFILVIILGVMLVGGNSQSGLVGGNGSRYPNGLSADTTSPIDGEVRGTTLNITSTSALAGAVDVGTFTQGGGVKSTTTIATTATLTASDFDTESLIKVIPGGASLALTLPASSTLSSFAPSIGDVRTIYVQNATTTAGIVLSISGGTGTILKVGTSTTSILGDTDARAMGKLTFVRTVSGGGGVGDLIVLFDAFTD